MMPDLVPLELAALHKLYESLTHTTITLNFFRLDCWRVWQGYRKHQPFTQDDLKVVVAYFKRTRKGGLLDGSLKFHNLVQQPDRFEEDLSIAKQALRPRPSGFKEALTPGTTTRRIVECDGTQEATVPIADVIKRMRAEVDKPWVS